MLPEAVLEQAQAELLDWQGTGVSVIETGHRTEQFKQLMRQAENDLRLLLNIPNNYHILFLGGAARTQFATIPLNFLGKNQSAAYLVSGIWSSIAFDEAKKLSNHIYCVADSSSSGYINLPPVSGWQIEDNTAYFYYTPNETINGVQFQHIPDCGSVPLVADMTSCILSEPIDVSRYALIFAGAQKNISAAGLTIIIIQDELLATAGNKLIPSMLDYRNHAKYRSLYATPPVFSCYLAAKMFEWVNQQGGVEKLYEINCLKASKLYQFIDASPFYECQIEKPARSIMNVCFALKRVDLEEQFLNEAEQNGLLALRGHRLTGGLRASLYNAMPMDGVDALIDFMQHFAEVHHS